MVNTKIFSKKASICYLQILILIVSSFAFSYLIYSSIGSVDASAEDDLNEILEDYACCEKTKSNYFCQYNLEEQCEGGNFKKSNTQCSETSFCKLGCCVGDAGFCSQNTPQTVCDNSGGKWIDSQYCAVDDCQRGCCTLGSNAEFITEKSCYFKAKAVGAEMNFNKAIKSEAECIYATMKEDEGACVDDNKYGVVECKFTTRGKCDKNSKFYKSTSQNPIYCSSDKFRSEYNLDEPICKPHDHTGCLDDMYYKNKFSVYWFDSCGNPEDIYDECDPLDSSICGKWRSQLEDGTKLVDSDYVCRKLDCNVMMNKNGVQTLAAKKNGESWCEYLGAVGNGDDVVGSEHILHKCQNGAEVIESCESYRNEICVEQFTKNENGSEIIFTTADCVKNGWRHCYQYNEDSATMAKNCNENKFCKIENVFVDSESFKFDVCVPAYPPGFDIKSSDEIKNGKSECNFGTQTCTIVYQKEFNTEGNNLDTKWDCKVNCYCETALFTQEMNDFCTKLGDCGLKVNYAGEKTENGYSLSGQVSDSANNPDLNKAIGSEDEEDKAIEPPPMSGEGGSLGNKLGYGSVSDDPLGDISGKWIGWGLGLGGVAFAGTFALVWGSGATASFSLSSTLTGIGSGSTVAGGSVGGASAVALQSVAAVGAAVAVAAIYSKLFKLQGQAPAVMMTVAILGGATGAVLLYATSLSWTGYGAAVVIIGLLLAVTLKYGLELGETKTHTATFTCLPSGNPLVADKTNKDGCDFCNKQSICTEYMCKSLGTDCELINKNDPENRRCISEPRNEISEPLILPIDNSAKEKIDSGMKIEIANQNDQGFEIIRKDMAGTYPDGTPGNCVPENTKLEFQFKTVYRANENLSAYSSCKIDNSFFDYEQMTEFIEDGIRKVNHTITLEVHDLDDGQKDGKLRKYITCMRSKQSPTPYIVQMCVAENDTTTPVIMKTIPANNPFIKFGATELPVSVYASEESECKWSANDFDYDKMEGDPVTCDYDTIYGYKCTSDMKLNIAGNNTKFYMRCKDKWDNKMVQSLVYTVQLSASDLKIDFIAPEKGFEKLIGLNEPAPVTLRVKLSGGAENGNSICSWWETEKGFSDDFDREYKNDHTYDFTSLASRTYYVDIKCEDKANNTAGNSTSFSVKVDNMPPQITRYYNDNGKLKVITNEDSKCKFGFSPITEFANATNMVSNDGLTHTADWKAPQTYYIKCEDKFNNRMGVDFKVYTYS